MELRKISEYEWQIPKEGEMLVPATIYASEKLLQSVRQDLTLQQARNVACLPGIQRMSYVMPDAHQGYGFPDRRGRRLRRGRRRSSRRAAWGTTSTAGSGCCGRTTRPTTSRPGGGSSSPRSSRRCRPASARAASPSSAGAVLRDILTRGAEWAVEQGYGSDQDLQMTEESGRMKDADPSQVSDRAMERGIPQLGTLGAGNHFLEIQKVSRIFDREKAASSASRPRDRSRS